MPLEDVCGDNAIVVVQPHLILHALPTFWTGLNAKCRRDSWQSRVFGEGRAKKENSSPSFLQEISNPRRRGQSQRTLQ